MIETKNKKSIQDQSQKKSPLISVIIPYYNGEVFIAGAVACVQKQTHRNWELIIVDDGSTDRSFLAGEAYMADHRIRIITHPTNRGIAATKNSGVSAARGRYVAFLDQDDLWIENKLELQINRFLSSREDVGIVSTGILFVDGNMKVRDIFTGFENQNRKELLKGLFLKPVNSSSIMLVKKSVFKKTGLFNEQLIGWDDYEFLFRAIAHFQIEYIREPLVIKRVHTHNMQNSEAVKNERNKVFARMVRLYPFLRESQYIRYGIDRLNEGRDLLKTGRKTAARRKLALSINCLPGSIFPRILFLFSFLPPKALSQIMKIRYIISGRANSIRAKVILRQTPLAAHEEFCRKEPGLRFLP